MAPAAAEQVGEPTKRTAQPIPAVWEELLAARRTVEERSAEVARLREEVAAVRRSESRLVGQVAQLREDLAERDERLCGLEAALRQRADQGPEACGGADDAPQDSKDVKAVDLDDDVQWVAASQVAQLNAAARSLADAVRAREARLAELEEVVRQQAVRIAGLEAETSGAKEGAVCGADAERRIAELQALAAWQSSRIYSLEVESGTGMQHDSPHEEGGPAGSAPPRGLAPAPAEAAPGGSAEDDQGEPVASQVAAAGAVSPRASLAEPVAFRSEQDCMTAIAAAVAGVLRDTPLEASAADAVAAPGDKANGADSQEGLPAKADQLDALSIGEDEQQAQAAAPSPPSEELAAPPGQPPAATAAAAAGPHAASAGPLGASPIDFTGGLEGGGRRPCESGPSQAPGRTPRTSLPNAAPPQKPAVQRVSWCSSTAVRSPAARDRGGGRPAPAQWRR